MNSNLKKSTRITFDYIDEKIKNGEEISLSSLIDFATSVDRQAIDEAYLSKVIEKGEDYYYLTQKDKESLKLSVSVEVPSASVIRLCKLPDSIMKFTKEQKELFYEKLSEYYSALEKKLFGLHAKINMERSERGIINY